MAVGHNSLARGKSSEGKFRIRGYMLRFCEPLYPALKKEVPILHGLNDFWFENIKILSNEIFDIM